MFFLLLISSLGIIFYLLADLMPHILKKVNIYRTQFVNFLLENRTLKLFLSFITNKLEKAGLIGYISIKKLIIFQLLFFCFLFFVICILTEKINIFILFLSLLISISLSFIFIENRIKRRQNEIFKSLPDIIDLLSLLVSSGLDFWTAIEIVMLSEENIITKELRAIRKEIELGKNRYLALQDISKRLDNKYIKSVFNSILYSLKLGVPIMDTLKSLSDELRVEKSHFAEKIASEAPIKMIIPMILFIFPTIFIMIFGPVVYFFMSGRI